MSFHGAVKRQNSGALREERPPKGQRRALEQQDAAFSSAQGSFSAGERRPRNDQQSFAREQTRLNQIQEAEQMREWVSKEDEFVLKQSKKKARVRVREGRARTIDWLAVTLGATDGPQESHEDDLEDEEADIIDPSGVFDGLSAAELQELNKDIETYLLLEVSARNRKYWKALRSICEDHQRRLVPGLSWSHGRSSNAVSADVDRLLSPKTLPELESLQKQIQTKLRSQEPIDVEYWEDLQQNVEIYKSKAELSTMYQSIIQERLQSFRREESEKAEVAKMALETSLDVVLSGVTSEPNSGKDCDGVDVPLYSRHLDPESMLRIRTEDKGLELADEKDFLAKMASDRQRIRKLGYIPSKRSQISSDKTANNTKTQASSAPDVPRFAAPTGEDFSSATTALYEREVSRGVQENEEIFAGEEEVVTKSKPQWAGKYRPRKPRYFNRVQMGYEWNKYNQTHYDHDNPPPKVVQGYKFNIFYPDLIDKTRAPTYRIERENGRKSGQSLAPAGEDDTCLIRFISGPPYEDIAFRILDKKWDLSAQRERGFKSSFEKGILQLHFQFKKVFYRK